MAAHGAAAVHSPTQVPCALAELTTMNDSTAVRMNIMQSRITFSLLGSRASLSTGDAINEIEQDFAVLDNQWRQKDQVGIFRTDAAAEHLSVVFGQRYETHRLASGRSNAGKRSRR